MIMVTMTSLEETMSIMMMSLKPSLMLMVVFGSNDSEDGVSGRRGGGNEEVR